MRPAPLRYVYLKANAEVETVAAAERQGTGDWWSQVSFIG